MGTDNRQLTTENSQTCPPLQPTYGDNWKTRSSTPAIWRKRSRVPCFSGGPSIPTNRLATFPWLTKRFASSFEPGGSRPVIGAMPTVARKIDQLTQELAYERWHRMLFARFLAENHLLMEPDGVAVTLDECEELAPPKRAPNRSLLAGSVRQRMLPQIFRDDDVLRSSSSRNERPLENLLRDLPARFSRRTTAWGGSISSGRARRRTRSTTAVRRSWADELPAVTQLFTEHYMVEFLLHNTFGAWWAGSTASMVRLEVRGCREGHVPGTPRLPSMEGRRHSRGGDVRGLVQDAQRVHHARPLLRQRAFPGGRLPSAGAAADAR